MTHGLLTIPAAEYHLDRGDDTPSLSSSIIYSLCYESPAHAKAKHPRLTPILFREDSEVMDIGTVVHALMLEGEAAACVLDFPDWRTKAAREARDAARANRQAPILAKNWAVVQEMACAAKEQLSHHKDASKAFTDGLPEQTLRWTEDGVRYRSRLDWIDADYRHTYDLKTTGMSANPDVFSRTIFANGLDIQGALYVKGVKAVTGVDTTFRFVVVETEKPHALSVIGLGPDVLALANKKIMYASEAWLKCLESGDFPGYPNRTVYPEVPAWAENQWLEIETRDL